VVISGAGIAGPALAFWLTHYGYRVIVVETAPGVRPGGQTVDLRGAGATVIERMGLLDEMHARALVQHGLAWVRSDGSRRAEMPVDAFDGNGLVSKLEILRGDLVDVLYTATRDTAEYRFGTRITDLVADPAGVEVTLADGTVLHADLVVGADGPHSGVRRLVFGPEEQFVRPLGGYHAWFTAPDQVGLDGWYLMYQAPPGRNASMRPSHDPAIAKAGLAFRVGPDETIDYDRHDLDAQRRLLTERMAGAGWQTDALLAAAAESDDFYFDAFAQVHMTTWSKGRVTLVGDAGYCASPLSGMGTMPGSGGRLSARGRDRPGHPTAVHRTPQPCLRRVRHPDAALRRPVPGSAERDQRVCAQDECRHRHHPAGDEMDAALAGSADRRPEVVHHSGFRRLARPPAD
jgi:2-polyprenyl-6-methoxyphenol hydroxylase-like FAD-dependent oxidoreductase